jgi:predicted alpha-1,6-mannanase (GH76 family)
VLGIQGAQRNFLNDALDVCDMLHRRFPKHISEQLATSIVMTKHFQVVDFRSYTYHWFGHGQAINNIIDEILFDYQQHDLETLMERVRSVRQRVVNAPLNRDKQPWYKRMFMPK